MKVVFVANFLPDTNYTRDLSQGFIKVMKPRDELFLCGRKNEPVTDGKLPGVDLVWLKGSFSFIPIYLYILKKKPNLVHLQHEFKTYGGVISAALFPWLISLLRLTGFKVVVTIHTVVSKKQIDKSFLEGFGLKDNFLNSFLVKLFLISIYKLIVFFSNEVTVHTDLLKTRLVEEYAGNTTKIITIAHGIREISDRDSLPKNPNMFKQFPILKGKKIILSFGYFSPRKGYELLIDSLTRVFEDPKLKKEWVMVLAGDVMPEFVQYKNKIQKLIKKKKIENSVLITGFVDAEGVNELYRMAKICVITAVYSFNTSGVLSVVLAYGKPLLVADVKPLAQEVMDNNFGLLFDLQESSSFKGKLQKLIEDNDFYERTKKSLRKSASNRYWSIIAKKHYELYRHVLKN